ncbi:MAG: zinc-ribbon domain-containing protein [Clostridia bacterium]|nr:zinc-ribbon domain-containing protein [Clostridia bacterium]
MGKLVVGKNDLETLYPDIAREWDYEKNGDLTPGKVGAGSKQKVWWICPKGHSYDMAVGNRTNQKQKCPYCSNKRILKGYNDLETLFPDVAKTWDYEKNGNLLPSMVTPRTNKKVFWICPNNHSYPATVAWRTNKDHPTACPYCSHNKVLSGFNDFATICPDKVKYWDYEKNGALKPNEITAHNGAYIFWKCPYCGYSWRTKVLTFSYGNGCPKCKSRRQTSFPEQAVFFYIKKLFPDAISRYKFENTSSLEFDVFIPKTKIAIEYDGWTWHHNNSSTNREEKKYRFCAEKGIYLIKVKEYSPKGVRPVSRLCNEAYYVDAKNIVTLNDALQNIIDRLDETTLLNMWLRPPSHNKIHSDVVVDINRDRQFILDSYYGCDVENSLFERYPNIVTYWDYEKNIISPTQISFSSTVIVWWKCADCGVSFQKPVNEVVHKGLNPLYFCRNCAMKRHYDAVRVSKYIPVTATDKDGNTITFDSLTSAMNYCISAGLVSGKTDRRKPSGICNCLKGKQKTAYGFSWKYKDS